MTKAEQREAAQALLRELSPTLPTFLASAYAFMRDGQEGEALMDAWIVAEQVLNLLWSEWIGRSGASNQVCRELRKDRVVQRRLNLLEACGQLEGEIATKLRTAAEYRNQVVHPSLTLDEGTWAPGRGWALSKALITHAKLVRSGTHTADAARRFGWRLSSRRVLDEVLTNA
jgi:hypothetical protein